MRRVRAGLAGALLVEIPGVARTPAGMDRRVVSVEEEQLYKEDGAA